MDRFSWFVGIYEGEGSFGSRIARKKYKGKVYENASIYLTIKMTDEDTIAKCADFLGVKYAPVERATTDKLGRKPLYRVRKMGGINEDGKLYTLIQNMLPHLSQRRQEQIQGHLDKAASMRQKT
tara:strand:+ start:82 stop:453 length:372 start_codon:yes stop_codon:yes gene_type:complete